MSATVEPWLREILRCPACRSTLLDVADDDGAPALRCSTQGGDAAVAGCGRTYRIERGVPVLLVDEGVLPAAGA